MRTAPVWALLAVVFAAGCASVPDDGVAETRAVAAQRALDGGRPAEAKVALSGGEPLSAEEQVILGEAELALGEPEAAEVSFYAARRVAGLSPDLAWRSLVGLGEISLAQGDGYSARARLVEAESVAPTRREVEIALVGQARAALACGEVQEAADLRRRIGSYGIEGLSDLDRALAAGRGNAPPVVSRTAPPPVVRPAPARPKPPEPEVAGRPAIIAREKWGAKAVRSGRRVVPIGRVSRITVHHTADRRLPGNSWAENATRMRSYQAGHQNGRRWADIGYHFVIDQKGRIWEGRDLGLKGAHAGNSAANRGNVGIALVGNFDRSRPTASQRTALRELLTWLCDRYHVAGRAVYTHDEMKRLHPELGGTACPGRYLKHLVVELRSRELSDGLVRSRRRTATGS